MDLRLEVDILPVTDVDKAKHFNETGLACRLDADVSRLSYATFALFSDPDGNGWLLPEITERFPERV